MEYNSLHCAGATGLFFGTIPRGDSLCQARRITGELEFEI